MNGVTNGNEDTIPLPSAKPLTISLKVTIQPPLTRRGNGPGLILLVPFGLDLNGHDKTLDPPPLQKWAEEGYAVAQITLTEGDGDKFKTHLNEAIYGLAEVKECNSTENMGLICMHIRLIICPVSDERVQRTTRRSRETFQASSTPRKPSWQSYHMAAAAFQVRSRNYRTSLEPSLRLLPTERVQNITNTLTTNHSSQSPLTMTSRAHLPQLLTQGVLHSSSL